MGRKVKRVPGEAHKHLALRALGAEQPQLSPAELIASVGQSRTALGNVIAHPDWVTTAPHVFPLLTLIKTGAPNPDDIARRTLAEWSERALLETALLELANHAAG